MVEAAVIVFRRRPDGPLELALDDRVVGFPHQFGFQCAFVLQVVEVFQEQHPRGLFDVIKLGAATGLLPEDIIEIPEGLFEHGAAAHSMIRLRARNGARLIDYREHRIGTSTRMVVSITG